MRRYLEVFSTTTRRREIRAMLTLLNRALPMTPEGADELALEVALMEMCREEVAAELRGAAEFAPHALRTELEALDSQLARLRDTLRAGVRVANTGVIVAIGSEVTLSDEEGERTLTIGGLLAANPMRGCISYDSPTGQALLGAGLGDHVVIPVEGGHRACRVVGIRRGSPGESVEVRREGRLPAAV